MAVTVATLISTCPAPVSDATGVTNGLVWLATAEAFCQTQTNTQVPNRHTIINAAENYFFETPDAAMSDYSDFNDKMLHIKHLLSGDNALTT